MPARSVLASNPPSMRSIVARAAAHDTGLPPKVEPCAPIGHVMRSARAIMAASGIPLAIPFPASRMSGSTPKC